MERKERVNQRNQQVKTYFRDLEEKHPQWKYSALLDETAKRFPPLSPATIAAIIREQGIYQSV
jgi:hypothetical protein